MQRRIRRRERNKTAAAKCRQRRIDQTSELLIVSITNIKYSQNNLRFIDVNDCIILYLIIYNK